MDLSRNEAGGRDYITLAQAAKLIPGRCGDRISLKSLHRWCRKGLRNGVLLRSEMVGGRRCTTRGWLEEFFEALTRDAEPEPLPRLVPRSGSGRRAASERAVEELEAAWGRKRP
jgi:hypothetical protein